MPSLIYSDRIVYLPIGIFAVSIGSVAMSNMSRSAAHNDRKGMVDAFSFCLRQLLFICIPAAIYVLFFRDDLIELFYLGGKFGAREVRETAMALQAYALGIPAFAAIKVSVSMFYSRKKMATPVKISLICIVLNIVLNLILMWPLKQGGIALATVISSYVNNLILYYFLKKEFHDLKIGLLPTVSKALISASTAAFITMMLEMKFFDLIRLGSFSGRFIHIVAVSTVFGFCYLLFSLMLGAKEPREIFSSLRNR